MTFDRPLTQHGWQAARRRARRQIAHRAGWLLLQGVILGVAFTPLMGFLTGTDKGVWMGVATANLFWLILAIERLLELRPLREEARPGLVAREGLARVQTLEGEVPLLVMDDLALATERWRRTDG